MLAIGLRDSNASLIFFKPIVGWGVPGGVPVFPVTDKLIFEKGLQRFQPMLETLDFAIGAIRKWQSLTHGPEDVQGV